MASGNSESSFLASFSKSCCECGICQDRYENPKMLACLHIFCLKCLQDLIATNPRSYSVSCPMCRRETEIPDTGAQGLITCFRTVSIMEYVARHEKQCPIHWRKAMQLFCTTCEVLICQDCTVVAHRKPKHVYIKSSLAAIKYKESLTQHHSLLEGKVKDIKQRLAIISQTQHKLSASKDRITIEVQEKAEELIQEITEQAMNITEGTERVEKRRQQQLGGTMKTLQQQLERFQQSLKKTRDLINIAPDSDFLSQNINSTINMDVRLLSGENTPEVDSRQLGLRFKQGQGADDINIGELGKVTPRRWELCREIGKEGRGPREFDGVRGIAARSHDDLAVADVFNQQVKILGVDGSFKCQIPLMKERPLAVALAKQSNRLIVVCDTQVKVFNPDNSLAFEFSTLPPDEAWETLVGLSSAAIKKDGNILVGDIHRKVVTEHSPTDGALIRTVPVGMKPYFLAVGSNNRLIISSWTEAIVHVTDCYGTSIFSIKPTIGGLPVKYCWGVWSDHSGLYIAVRNKTGTGHIHHYDAQGAFLTCIAQGLYRPRGITMTPAGQLVVADHHSVKIYHYRAVSVINLACVGENEC